MGFVINTAATSGKGNRSEAKVMTAYVAAGFTVLLPFGNGAPYDLAVDLGHRVLKVQVKTGRLRRGCVLFQTQRFSGSRVRKHKYYSRDEMDVFAVYCPENDKIYVQKFGDARQGWLRCKATKNHQRKHIRWAHEYEFEKHLEFLREEQTEVEGKGMELSGIEPLTS